MDRRGAKTCEVDEENPRRLYLRFGESLFVGVYFMWKTRRVFSLKVYYCIVVSKHDEHGRVRLRRLHASFWHLTSFWRFTSVSENDDDGARARVCVRVCRQRLRLGRVMYPVDVSIGVRMCWLFTFIHRTALPPPLTRTTTLGPHKRCGDVRQCVAYTRCSRYSHTLIPIPTPPASDPVARLILQRGGEKANRIVFFFWGGGT